MAAVMVPAELAALATSRPHALLEAMRGAPPFESLDLEARQRAVHGVYTVLRACVGPAHAGEHAELRRGLADAAAEMWRAGSLGWACELGLLAGWPALLAPEHVACALDVARAVTHGTRPTREHVEAAAAAAARARAWPPLRALLAYALDLDAPEVYLGALLPAAAAAAGPFGGQLVDTLALDAQTRGKAGGLWPALAVARALAAPLEPVIRIADASGLPALLDIPSVSGDPLVLRAVASAAVRVSADPCAEVTARLLLRADDDTLVGELARAGPGVVGALAHLKSAEELPAFFRALARAVRDGSELRALHRELLLGSTMRLRPGDVDDAATADALLDVALDAPTGSRRAGAVARAALCPAADPVRVARVLRRRLLRRDPKDAALVAAYVRRRVPRGWSSEDWRAALDVLPSLDARDLRRILEARPELAEAGADAVGRVARQLATSAMRGEASERDLEEMELVTALLGAGLAVKDRQARGLLRAVHALVIAIRPASSCRRAHAVLVPLLAALAGRVLIGRPDRDEATTTKRRRRRAETSGVGAS